MFCRTHNNHFSFDEDNVHYSRCSSSPLSFPEECKRAASLIYQNSLGLKPNLAFSGGIDSEVMVRSFIEANVPFDITILKFEQDLNEHDIIYAIDYCTRHSLQYNIVNLDIKKFWASDDFREVAYRTKCVSPQITTHIWLMEQMDGLPVFGCGEPVLTKDPPAWKLWESERQMAMFRTNKIAVPLFFHYLPEQMYSFLESPFIRWLINGTHPYSGKNCPTCGTETTQSLKPLIYKQWFPNLVKRQKFNGFESVDWLDQQIRSSLVEAMPNNARHFLTEYHSLMKMLSHEQSET